MPRRAALNASRMKGRNYRRILEELRISPFSRSELARRTGLTRAAISLIVDALLQKQVLVEGQAISTKTAGRAPIELHWNKDAFYCVGIAIRRGYFAVGLYNFCGGIISVQRQEICPPYNNADAIFRKIIHMIEEGIQTHKPKGTFLGIGVGAPGPLDAEAGTIDNPTNLEILHNTPVVGILKQHFGCPVMIMNDACTHALAELYYGVKDSYDSFVVIEVTGGLGAGIVRNGKLISGTLGNGNEIGHTSINVFGERCQCGNIGCAELYATMDAIVAHAQEVDPRLTSWKKIVDYASEGMATAIEVLREEAYYLASLAINLLNTLEVNAVLFNGREICYKPKMLLAMIREQVPSRLVIKKYHTVDFLTTTIMEDADTLSAANLAIENFLENIEDTFLSAE